MKYIDVRIRIPIAKMGMLVEELPEWAAMVGYDKLQQAESSPASRKYARNGSYKPTGAREAVLRVLANRPLRRFEIIERLKGKQKEKAVSSAIHALAFKKIIKKHADGSYGQA